MIIAPGMQIDRFEVIRLLGEGGLARVYLVRHRKLKSLHALKALHVSSEKSLKRFLLEGQVQAGIRHPNVVAVTDVVELEDQVGLVMEYIEGTTLADVLVDGRPLPATDVASIFRELCEGVMEAHRHGVLHRDLKPGNVLLAISDHGVRAKITDFGIAKVAREVGLNNTVLTEAGTMIGTPGYMAPEQVTDASRCDVRADVFSLGCILYEMLVGRAPYMRGDRMATFNATLAGEHIPASQVDARVLPELDAVIERAIHPDLSVRFSTVSELLAAVIPALVVMPRSASATLVASDGPAPTPLTEVPPRSQGWAQDQPLAGATARRVGVDRAPSNRITTSGRSGPLLDFRRRSRWGPRNLVAPILLVLTCGGAVAWSVEENAAEVRQDVVDVRARSARLDSPWQATDGAVARAWALVTDRESIEAQVEIFREAPAPTPRVEAGHTLVRMLRAEVSRQMQTLTTAEARTELAGLMHELDTIDGQLSAEERRIDAVVTERRGLLARVAEQVGWLGPDDEVDAPVLDPLPELAAVNAPPPPVVATRPGRRVR